jgi:serine/threonine protein kinase
VITDLGLSRRINNGISASDGTTGFTREYAAPELLPNKDENEFAVLMHTRRTDIFSLGCVFAEMITVATSTRTLEEFRAARNNVCHETRRFGIYAKNLSNVNQWLDNIQRSWPSDMPDRELWDLRVLITKSMLSEHYGLRPEHGQLVRELKAWDCCDEKFLDCQNFWTNP